jgi:hypothetical protein
MLTILNIINYLIGKPLSLYVLILATIVVYYWVLSNYWETCYNNKLYLIIVTILLLIDITMIIIIFTISHDYDSDKIDSEKKLIKNKKSKKDKKKNKIITLENEPQAENVKIENIQNPDKVNPEFKPDAKSLIEVYDPEAEVSLNTYS